MKLIGEISIDLEEIFVGEDWGETVADIIRDEIKKMIREALKEEFKDNVEFVGAMKEIRTKAAAEIIDMVVKWKDSKHE